MKSGSIVSPQVVTVEEAAIFVDIRHELAKARILFPEQSVWVTLAALAEELGELNKDVLHYNFEPSRNKSPETIRIEAIQVAVMAIRVALDCDHDDKLMSKAHRWSHS